MKSFKFKTKATVLKGVKEQAPKKAVNWDRVIYLMLFVVILLSIFYYAFTKSFYVNAYGEIYTEQFSVQLPEDITVKQYFVSVEDTVEKGDTLFYYRLNLLDGDDNNSAVAAVVSTSSSWYIRERIQTQKSISIAYIDIEQLNQDIMRIKKHLELMRKEVYLDVYPKVELKKASLDIEKYYVDINRKEQEIAYLKKYLSLLNYYEQQEKNNVPVINTGGDAVLWSYYISPVNGLVSKVFKDTEEVTYKKDIVMYLNSTEELFVLAFVSQKDFKYFSVDEDIELFFPDNTKGVGVISHFYMNTEEMPIELSDSKLNNERRIVIRLTPENQEEADKWGRFHLMEVKIRKSKFY